MFKNRFKLPFLVKYILFQNRFSRVIYSLIPERIINIFKPIIYITIELSNSCNLKCPFCTQWRNKKSKKLLSFEEFKEIYRKLPDTIKVFTLHFSGESFLNPELPTIIKFLNDRKKFCWVSTNGTLNYERYKSAIDAGLNELRITLDGITKEKHEKYRVGSNFYHIVENIKHLVLLNNKNTKLIIQYIVMKENEKDIPQLIKFGRELGVKHINLKTLSLNICSDSILEQKKQNSGLEFLPENSLFSRYRSKKGKLYLKYPRVICPDIRKPAITADGDIVLCCIDIDQKVRVGNIFQIDSFIDFWNSKQYRKIRKLALFKQIELCKRCNFDLKGQIKIKL